MCLTCIAAGIATASFSFSWFTNTNNVTRPVEGHTAGAYFAGGSGKKDDPYIISSPTHLYNLAWLYYIGYFKDEEPYFTISQDIDMNGWTLPPIGTSTHPFNGHLDANSHKISNLKVSNSYDDLKSRKPSNVTEDDWLQNDASKGYGPTPNVLGMFGYVAKESDDKGIPSIENLYINSEKVNSTTTTALTGIVAGYVDGKLDKIYIDNSTVTVADNTKAVGILGDETISNISAYTSVGYCTENYRTKYNKYETTLYEPCYVASTSKDSYIPGGGSGQEDNWGGSIDFESLNQRITYIMANSTKSSYNYKSSAFNTNIYYTSSTTFNVTTASLQSAILNSGTYLPLNVDTSTITESNYKSASSETILSTNTGYIVGEGSGSNGYLRSIHNKTNKDNSVVNCSFYTLNSEANSPSRDDSLSSSNISFLWLANDGKTYRIQDNDNKDNVSKYAIPTKYKSSYSSGIYAGIMNSGTSDTSYTGLNLIKYSDVKNNFISSLAAATTETFYGTGCYLALNYLQLKTKTEPTATTYSNITLNGTTGSYDLFSGGINYTLKQDGYMSMLCGMSYQGAGEKGNLPDIYYVDSSSGTKTLKKIYKIIKANGKTAFKFDDSSLSSDETLVFDLDKMSTGTLMEVGGIYYFEFPMIAGDYFMTRYDSTAKVYVPYIYYLDIGANAGDGGSSSNEVTRTKVFELLEQITQSFTYPTGVYVADFDNAVLDTKTLCITLGATYSGEAKVDRTKNNVDTTVTTDTSNNTGLAYFDSSFEKVTENNAETTSSDVNEGESTLTTKRMTYFDCSSTSLTMFRFSQTSIDGREYSSITAETQYQANTTTGDDGTITLGDWEETSDQTVYNDDGTKTDETNGIPSDISSGITQPTDFSTSTNVFNLKLLVNKVDTFSNEYLSNVTLDENKKAKVVGYDLTLENNSTKVTSTDYSVTRNANYSLSINDEAIS